MLASKKYYTATGSLKIKSGPLQENVEWKYLHDSFEICFLYKTYTIPIRKKRIAYRRTLEKWLNDGTPSKEKKLETYQRRLEFWENLSSVWIRIREKNALPLFVGPSQKWQRGSCCHSEADNGGFHANFDAATNTAIVLMLYSTKYFCIKTEYVRFLFFLYRKHVFCFCTDILRFVFLPLSLFYVQGTGSLEFEL